MDTSGLKLGLGLITSKIENSKCFGCLERFSAKLDPIAEEWRKQNTVIVNQKLRLQASENEQLVNMVTEGNLFHWTKEPIRFVYSCHGNPQSDLYVYYNPHVYDKLRMGHLRIQGVKFRVERTWYYFGYKFIEALTGAMPF